MPPTPSPDRASAALLTRSGPLAAPAESGSHPARRPAAPDGRLMVPRPGRPAGSGSGPAGDSGADAEQRRCPRCGVRVPERLSPSGQRQRGRPRVFCSERCRLGDRRARAAVDPGLRRDEVAAFAAAVRAGIARRGLSLRELESLLVAEYGPLASSVATLSAWQTGASSPPRTLTGRSRVLALERCLGLPAGDLALLMPGGAMVPVPRPPTGPDGLPGRHARLKQLVTALTGPQQLLPVSLSKDYRLGASRRPLCTRITMRVRAAHDGVDRYWFVDASDPRLHPTVVETSGCRAGRYAPEPLAPVPVPRDQRLVAAELLFGRRLARGEYHRFSFLVQYDAEVALPRMVEPIFRHVQVQPCERLDLTLSFDRRSLPSEVLQCRWRQRDLAEVSSEPKTRPGCLAYQLVVADPVPGCYGWRWEWAPALDSVAGVGRRPPPGASAA